MARSRAPGVTAIQYTGPFFEKDPVETFGRNARRLMDRVAEVGENEVKRRIAGVPTKMYGAPLSVRYVWGRTSSLKGKRVFFEGQKGTTEYMHATLADVCAAAIKGLAEVGISHQWEVEQKDGVITVTCILTHAQGHNERTRMHGPPDPSGSKNAIQAIGSAVTYLQRYTLLAATGLAAKDIDTDGRSPGIEFITAEQVADLEALITEVGANREVFLKFCRVARIEELPAAKHKAAVQALEAKRRG